MKSSRWNITTVTENDKAAIIELFHEVFAPEKMSDALWEWKYGDGRGLGIVAWRDGKMVAHYGGIVRHIRYFGEDKLAVQITDVMVSPTERGVFTRRGAFFLITASFLENYIGYEAPTWLGYGFPSERHQRLAQNLGLYAAVGKIVELHWQTRQGKPHLFTRIAHFKQNKNIINKLWNKMAESLRDSLVAVRDWNYVQYRYLLNPQHKYELLLVTRRFTGEALCLVVIYRQEETCHIRDFIGDLKYIPEAIKQVLRIAGNWGMCKVHMWITENFANMFPLQDAEQQELEIYVPHNVWSKSFPPEEIDGRWWLMSGDTDFL